MIYYLGDITDDLDSILQRIYAADYFLDDHGRTLKEDREMEAQAIIIDAMRSIEALSAKVPAPTTGVGLPCTDEEEDD